MLTQQKMPSAQTSTIARIENKLTNQILIQIPEFVNWTRFQNIVNREYLHFIFNLGELNCGVNWIYATLCQLKKKWICFSSGKTTSALPLKSPSQIKS